MTCEYCSSGDPHTIYATDVPAGTTSVEWVKHDAGLVEVRFMRPGVVESKWVQVK